MNIYELKHLFYKSDGELFQSELKLGYFYSMEDVYDAIRYYNTQPGFLENQDSYTVRVRSLNGLLEADEFYEATVYIYSGDYNVEAEIEVGLYADIIDAESALNYHNSINGLLNANSDLTIEYIINKIKINQLEWREGFTVS